MPHVHNACGNWFLWQKFRESNVFTKELIWRIFLSRWQWFFYFSTLWCAILSFSWNAIFIYFFRFSFARPQPSLGVSRQLNLDAKIKSPASIASSSVLSPTSSKEPSPFRFPDPNLAFERRDSIFCGPGDLSKLVKPVTPISSTANADLATPNHSNSTLTPGTAQANNSLPHGSFSSVAMSSSALLGSASKQKPRMTPVSNLWFILPWLISLHVRL